MKKRFRLKIKRSNSNKEIRIKSAPYLALNSNQPTFMSVSLPPINKSCSTASIKVNNLDF